MKNMHKPPKEEAWESRKLGASEKFVRKSSSKHEKNLDANLGLQTISIRLQKNLIEDLKSLASADGIGYQPYIRQLLMRHVRNEKSQRHKPIRSAK